MYIYKRTIKSGQMIEIEYYKSFRKVGKNYGGRACNKSKSPQKQKIANKLRAVKTAQRIINCNWGVGDWWCRFSAPYGTFDTEQEFRRCVSNWFVRIKRRCKKQGIDFKYYGFIECGKSGKNWHIHIILSDEIRKIAQDCWQYKNGMDFRPLYEQGNFEALATYIQKDSNGEKRMMSSRNLKRPEIKIREAGKREIRKLERGEIIKIPEGYYISKDDDNYNYNDITGASWYFKLLPLEYRQYEIF